MQNTHMQHIAPEDFAATVLKWQQQHGRHDLPWQQPATPYRVLVSEIMLQQTQVVTVIPYFQRWMQAFPSISALAEASEDEVMALWQGLGYYSRARNLQKAARYIEHELAGEFPNELQQLEMIPGVGRYTAGAIRSFAYDRYGPIVDGNVRRLFCRLFAIEGQPTAAAVNKALWQQAERLTPEHNNRRFAQGLLDLGATLCKPRNPECTRCPFNNTCTAYTQNRVGELPTAKLKKTLPTKTGHFLWLPNEANVMLSKRPDKGIWASLWCLPEVSEAPAEATLVASFKHTFSHYKLIAKVWQPETGAAIWNELRGGELRETNTHYQRTPINLQNIHEFGLPAPMLKLLNKLLQEDSNG